MNVDENFEAGKIIKDKYEIIDKIGKGGFAFVYKAKDLINGEEIAIKRITKKHDYGIREIEAMRDLLREDDRKKKLIVPLLDHFYLGSNIILILPYYPHGSLRDYVKSHEMSHFTIAFVLKQLVKSLQFLHRRSYGHRDITTGNILVSRVKEGSQKKVYVVLADFGLAREIVGQVKGTTVGTQGFIHPSIENGKKYGVEVDVYSLGCVFYSLLTRRDPPREKKSSTNISIMINEAKQNCGERTVHLLERMLDANNPILLSEILRHNFITQFDITDFDSVITNQRHSNLSRSNSQCRHRGSNCICFVDKENIRNGNKKPYQRDSALGSIENYEEKTLRRCNSANNMKQRHLAIEPPPRNDVKVSPWPLPEFLHLSPYTFVSEAKGRFIIEGNSIIFEKLDKSGYITSLMKVSKDRDGQTVEVYRPKLSRIRLLTDKDQPIEVSGPGIIFKNPYLSLEYSEMYRLIPKAIGMIEGRVPKIDYIYVFNNPKVEAKLMQNGDIRLLFFESKIFVRKKGHQKIECTDKSNITMTDEQMRLFLRTESYLLWLDEGFRRELGQYYGTQTLVGKKNNTKVEDHIPRKQDQFNTGTMTTRERTATVASEPIVRRRSYGRR